MATGGPTFNQWLREAKIDRQKLSPDRIAVLEASFLFVQHCGGDYYSRRVLSHFLLNCESGLQVSQIARILGVSRSTASEQQNISSKEMIQIAHHRMAGRPHGNLLARYAGPIAQFLITHPKASRLDILDFIERTWQVRTSTVALYHFLKKYGLDRAQRSLAAAAERSAGGPEVVQVAGWIEANLAVPRAEFFCPDGVRGGVPPPADCVEMALDRAGVLPRRLWLLVPGAVDQRLRLGDRARANVPSRSDGGFGIRFVDGRMAMLVASFGGRLASPSGLVPSSASAA